MKISKAHTIKSQTVTITPAMAEEWLDTETINIANRGLSKDTVQRYAHDMLTGNWMVGEPIMFDWEGVLIDGQHRLAAVIESGTEQDMQVSTGHDPEVRLRLNTGKSRNAQDALRIAGMSVRNSSIVVGIARMALLWEAGGLATIPSNGGQSFTNLEIVLWVNDHPEAEELAYRGRRAAQESDTNAQAFGFAMSVLEKVDKAAALEFEDKLVNHIQGGKTDPIFQLRDALEKLSAKGARPGTGLRHHQHLALLFLAWNRFRKVDRGTAAFTHQANMDRIAIHAPMPIPE